jgi:biuret amidohydrolase
VALRDCGIVAFATSDRDGNWHRTHLRHGAYLGYIPVVVTDACGFGHRDAAARSFATLEFAGDALLANVEILRL